MTICCYCLKEIENESPVMALVSAVYYRESEVHHKLLVTDEERLYHLDCKEEDCANG